MARIVGDGFDTDEITRAIRASMAESAAMAESVVATRPLPVASAPPRRAETAWRLSAMRLMRRGSLLLRKRLLRRRSTTTAAETAWRRSLLLRRLKALQWRLRVLVLLLHQLALREVELAQPHLRADPRPRAPILVCSSRRQRSSQLVECLRCSVLGGAVSGVRWNAVQYQAWCRGRCRGRFEVQGARSDTRGRRATSGRREVGWRANRRAANSERIVER